MMFTVDLECENGHRFEGWYDSRAEYVSIRDAGELSCPLCESHEVRNVLTTGDPVTSKRAAKQQRIEFVDNFADEAIAMYSGEKGRRPIAGWASDEQEQRLDEAGIPYGKVRVISVEDEPDPTEIN